MNIAQIIINAATSFIPGNAGNVVLAIEETPKVAQAFTQMPHLESAASAPDFVSFLGQVGQFLASPSETSAFASMVGSIAGDAYESSFFDLAGKDAGGALALYFSAIESLSTAFELTVGQPSGSVSLIAQ
jgi:hypothetical protein